MNTDHNASRRCIIDAIEHREPDRVPFDLGSSIETGITVQAYDRFSKPMGWAEEPDDALPNLFVQAAGFRQMPENILRHLKVDTRGTLIQLPSEPVPEIAFEGTAVTFRDERGIKWARRESSLHMDPVEGPFRGTLTHQRFDDYAWPIRHKRDASRSWPKKSSACASLARHQNRSMIVPLGTVQVGAACLGSQPVRRASI